MGEKKKNAGKKKRKWLWMIALGLVLAAGAFGLLRGGDMPFGIPVLTVETPAQKLSAGEEFMLDVTVSHLGEALYPAMSASIAFDSSRLEFLGVEEGNVFVLDASNTAGQQLPEWSFSVESSNESGRINVMYLDLTGGRHAFSCDLLAEEDNVMLRLRFRLRGSARSGDVLDLIVEDAVFAASDEAQSLAVTRGTLRVRNGRLVVGEIG